MGNYNTQDIKTMADSVKNAYLGIIDKIVAKGGTASTETGLIGVPDAIDTIPSGGGTMKALQILPSNETQNFNPQEEGVDGYDWVSAEGYDVDPVMSFMEQIRKGFEPTILIFANWDQGPATVNGMTGVYPPVTEDTIDILSSINWRSNTNVSWIEILDASNISDYTRMFNSTSALQSITADLGNKDRINMQYMFADSGITNIMNLGLETCRPTSLASFARNSQITALPLMDTSNCTSFNSIIANNTPVQVLPAYSYAAMTTGSINWGSNNVLTLIEGTIDLGMSFTRPYTVSITATYTPNISKLSAWNIVNSVFNFTTVEGHAGNGSTLNFSGYNWEWEEGEMDNLVSTANAKGWNITF